MPRCAWLSAALPTSAQMPSDAERTYGIASVMTRTPFASVVLRYNRHSRPGAPGDLQRLPLRRSGPFGRTRRTGPYKRLRQPASQYTPSPRRNRAANVAASARRTVAEYTIASRRREVVAADDFLARDRQRHDRPHVDLLDGARREAALHEFHDLVREGGRVQPGMEFHAGEQQPGDSCDPAPSIRTFINCAGQVTASSARASASASAFRLPAARARALSSRTEAALPSPGAANAGALAAKSATHSAKTRTISNFARSRRARSPVRRRRRTRYRRVRAGACCASSRWFRL